MTFYVVSHMNDPLTPYLLSFFPWRYNLGFVHPLCPIQGANHYYWFLKKQSASHEDRPF